jgi:hypothetical protein
MPKPLRPIGNNTTSATFTVLNVASAFTSIPVTTATKDVPYIYTATAEDTNGGVLTITALILPAWLTLTDHWDGAVTISGTPSSSDVGDNAVELVVTDDNGLTDTQSFVITVWYGNYIPLVLRNKP